eukprot:TRINITY_DN3485_c0_g2_i1.p1 TRINITY_DN3485_c0_g2~~TRINITY_DN3485_c0_g2_i1.p1  ORF type:complete len:211 (-),score=36.91 TRINITY_DN3485_c0_g2_i1:197-829(-)
MANITEPLTGISLPSLLKHPSTGKVLHLLGLGFRETKIAGADVRAYAIGLYVDKEVAVEALSSYSSKSGDALAGDEGFYSAIANAGVDIAYLISLNTDAGDRFQVIFKGFLAPLTIAAGGTLENVDEFLVHLTGKTIVKGTKVFISLAHPAPAAIAIIPAGTEGNVPEGVEVHIVNSPALTAALKNLYLGGASISPSIKKSIAERFASGF